jgi:hypothetical protein
VRGILLWLAVTCTVYLLGGLWVGEQLRPAVRHYQNVITSNVNAVTEVLK